LHKNAIGKKNYLDFFETLKTMNFHKKTNFFFKMDLQNHTCTKTPLEKKTTLIFLNPVKQWIYKNILKPLKHLLRYNLNPNNPNNINNNEFLIFIDLLGLT